MIELGYNLQEIYSACKDTKSKETSLVPSLFTQRIYDSASGWGRLWKWFYQAIHFLSGKDLKTKRLTESMQKTQAVFTEKLALIVQDAKTYQSYLKKRIEEKEVDEKIIHPLRAHITQWTRSTASFATHARRKGSKITALFETYYSDAVKKGKDLFTYGEKTKLLRETQLLIDLEGYLQQPLPIPVLKKIAQKKNLSTEENHEVKFWVDLLNKNKDQIPVGLFLDCLKHLIDQPNFGGSLTHLQIQLLQKGLTLLKRSEKKHLSWRAKLKAGDQLTCKKNSYVLGNPIKMKKCEKETSIFFEIKGNSHHVIAIGINRAYWPIKAKIAEEYQWSVPMPTIRSIFNNGQFAVIEKFSPAINKNQWISQENQPLKKQDTAILTPIANLLKWWGMQAKYPLNFSLSHLMFNCSGELKYTHALQPQSYSFCRLEDLTLEIAQDNLNIYLFLFETSNLNHHKTINFYRSVVEKSLHGEALQAKHLAACRKITDPEVIKRGKALYKEMQKMRANILKTLNKEYEVADQERLLNEANQQLLLWYKQTCSTSHIWHSIEPSVTRNLRCNLNIRQGSMASGNFISSK